MRILQVNKFNYIRGGAEKYFIDLSKKLEIEGHQVAIFCMHHPKNNPSPWDKYFVSRISFNEKKLRDRLLAPGRILYSFEARRKFKKIIKDFKPDIIHVHNIYHQLSPSILPIAKKFKIPVVMHLHDYKLICPNYQLFTHDKICYRCKGQKYYNCLRFSCFKKSFWQSLLATIEMYFHHSILNIYKKNIDCFIAPSQFMKETVVSFGIPGEKVFLVYNFSEESLVKEINKGKEDDYGLYFGRLSGEKGIDVLLNSLSFVKNKINIKIVGAGPEEKNLKDLSSQLNLEDSVDFVGPKFGSELFDIVSKAKMIFLPSVWAENMPLVLLESLSLGKIVIASKTGGLSELIEDKKSGFLFENGNYKDLSEVIDSVDDYDLNKIKSKAKEISDKLNINSHLEKILNIYKKYVK
ncbi:hypothetical protein CVU82_02245 [Candidatus Falkowbacteria bacterium HGW-Falkowbacteria-1]|uniref:Group 1 glycosyl transferase n=1 Tax=Candidatus Falkowbacteria bacterium HGW-Falkowbacteria-1 TaxID=2013768 RepID=A0A2N2E9K6_9BACT|nr:MAG: hypothetical protein CVU82_02245 [Candidatus Falkowbacteria bacterium HGW-Falkowbacteria-1]